MEVVYFECLDSFPFPSSLLRNRWKFNTESRNKRCYSFRNARGSCHLLAFDAVVELVLSEIFYFSPEDAAKNRLVSPTKVLHFFKLSKEIDTAEKLINVFENAGVPVPVACDFMTPPPRRISLSGHMVSQCS